MWIAAIIIMISLGIIVLVQRMKEVHRNRELDYMIEKLANIIEKQDREQLKVVTSDEQIRRLVEIMNEVLDQNSHNLASYKKSQESMKKMLSNISHDLKTPLTVVLGYLEIENLKDKSEKMEIVYQKVQEVLSLMNEFFDLEKLEAS